MSVNIVALAGHGETSYWNYRVIHRVYGDEDTYRLHEVHYDKDDVVRLYSEDPIFASGETVEELRGDLEYMLRALEKPALEWVDLPGWKPERDA